MCYNRKNGRFFCCQRGPGRALANKWEFPGGKVKIDEIKENALIREIRAELKSDKKNYQVFRCIKL